MKGNPIISLFRPLAQAGRYFDFMRPYLRTISMLDYSFIRKWCRWTKWRTDRFFLANWQSWFKGLDPWESSTRVHI